MKTHTHKNQIQTTEGTKMDNKDLVNVIQSSRKSKNIQHSSLMLLMWIFSASDFQVIRLPVQHESVKRAPSLNRWANLSNVAGCGGAADEYVTHSLQRECAEEGRDGLKRRFFMGGGHLAVHGCMHSHHRAKVSVEKKKAESDGGSRCLLIGLHILYSH